MPKKRYKIVITEMGDETVTVGAKWLIGADTNKPEPGYGYSPEIETTETVERQIYTQNVETIDLKAVIRAVNDMEGP